MSLSHRSMAAIRRCRHLILRTLIVAAVSAAVMATARAGTFADGLSAFNTGDYAAAYSIWLPLAEQGDANAQSSIAYLFHEGKGVRRDSGTAAKWYYLAANQGEPTAQSFLCEMHMRGDGVPRDLSLSLMWCELSIDGGEKRGIGTRERVLSKMSEAQRDLAWKLVAQWREARAAAEAAVPPVSGTNPLTYVDRH
jgi:uncharacterized protein